MNNSDEMPEAKDVIIERQPSIETVLVKFGDALERFQDELNQETPKAIAAREIISEISQYMDDAVWEFTQKEDPTRYGAEGKLEGNNRIVINVDSTNNTIVLGCFTDNESGYDEDRYIACSRKDDGSEVLEISKHPQERPTDQLYFYKKSQ